MSFDKGREIADRIRNDELMTRFLELQERMVALQQEQAKSVGLQEERTRPKENPNYVPDSIFMRKDGTPWSKTLKCEMFFGPYPLHDTPLTETEVNALNLLEPIESVIVEKTDGARAKGSVAPKYDNQGRLKSLTITLPMAKDDNPQMYPRLVDLAKQLAPVQAVA